MKIRSFFAIVLCLALVSCGNKTGKDKVSIDSILDESEQEGGLEISTESLNSIIQSIPSPLEVAMVIMQSGSEFNDEFLNSLDNSKLYTTDQEKAMNIGIYSGDIGYINIYEKSYLALTTLTTIKGLGDDINVGQFFDVATIKRLASQSDKIDSLIFTSTNIFNKMDAFLRTQKRSNLSILMVTGTWTEGLYIATRVINETHSKDLIEWVGYQKVIVDQLILGLSAYKRDEYFQKLITDLTSLKAVYDKISITYDYHEPESVEIDGRLVIVDKSTSTVNISDEQVKQVGELVSQIRQRLVKSI